MEEAMAARYYCHMCSQMVNPIMEAEIKCPFCQSGFIEEVDGSTRDNPDTDSEFGSERALSLWAPILLGMMGNSRRNRRFRREFEEEGDDNDSESLHAGETELDRELESIIRRRRRNSATIIQLLQGIRAGMVSSESENSEEDRDRDRDRDRNRDRERERVILINPFSQTITVQGSYDSSNGENRNQPPIGSLGDYFIGPGLDLLLQHLAENDPNRYGTPPARKEAIDALPTVAVKESLQCSVCLDDFAIGTEAKEMPCQHKFHTACLLPWLELHSSCPVCRFQLPAAEMKLDSERPRNVSNQGESVHPRDENDRNTSVESNVEEDREGRNGTGRRFSFAEEGDGEGRNGTGRRFSFPWPFNSLFSSNSAAQSSGGDSSSSSTANPSRGNASGAADGN